MNDLMPAQKGARTVATIDVKILEQLEAGAIETANLTESLGMNMNKLLLAVVPSIRRNLIDASLGVVQRMAKAAAIPLLRLEASLALPLLNALRQDTEKYVKNSMANWLNDAAKDQPKWVRSLLSKCAKDGVGV